MSTEESHDRDERSYDDVQKVEQFSKGASIDAKLKRGTGTRDQDTITIKGKGEDAEEAMREFETMLERVEDEFAQRLRAIDEQRGAALSEDDE